MLGHSWRVTICTSVLFVTCVSLNPIKGSQHFFELETLPSLLNIQYWFVPGGGFKWVSHKHYICVSLFRPTQHQPWGWVLLGAYYFPVPFSSGLCLPHLYCLLWYRYLYNSGIRWSMNTFLRCLNTFIKFIKLLIIDYFDAIILFFLFFLSTSAYWRHT